MPGGCQYVLSGDLLSRRVYGYAALHLGRAEVAVSVIASDSTTTRLRLRARTRLSQRPATRSRHLAVKHPAPLDRPLLARVVHVHDAEPLRVPLRPLEVVEQRPDEVAAQIDAA